MDDTDIASSEIHGEFRPLGQSSSGHDSTPVFDTNGKASSSGSELRTDISTTLTEEDKDNLDVADWKAIIDEFVCFADPSLKTIELQSNDGHDSTPVFDTNGKAPSPGSELRTDISTTLTEEDKDNLDVVDWKAIIDEFVCFADPPLKTIELQSNDDNYLSVVIPSGSSENTVGCQDISSCHEDTSHSTNGQPENTNELLESGKDTGNGKRKHLESEKDTKEEKKNCKGLKSEEDEKKGKGKGRERKKDEKKKGKKSKEEIDEDKRIYATEYRKKLKKYKQNLENKVTELENKVTELENKVTERENKVTERENKVTQLENKNTELENEMTLKDEKIADLQNKLRNFEKPNTLNDQMINDPQRQVEYPENKITSLNLQIKNQEAEKAHKISTMSHSHVVSGNYPKVSPSQNVIKENELKEMIHQAEALAMDPEIFLKFMNDWLVKKGMSEIRLGNERSGFLPSLREEERSFKTRIIKTYRKIMYDKRYFEQIRQDCEFIGLE